MTDDKYNASQTNPSEGWVRVWNESRGHYHWGFMGNVLLDCHGTVLWQFAYDTPEPAGEGFFPERTTETSDRNGVIIFEGDIVGAIMARRGGKPKYGVVSFERG